MKKFKVLFIVILCVYFGSTVILFAFIYTKNTDIERSKDLVDDGNSVKIGKLIEC